MISVAVACEKRAVAPTNVSGTFKGTFERKGPTTNGVANVTVLFNGSQFSGQSNIPRYPAISTGSFTVVADSIAFHDASMWTADFDWTLILDGKYKIIIQGDSLELHKYYNGIVYMEDVYKLKKQ